MSGDDDEPDWDRIGLVCEAVLLRLIEDNLEDDDADRGVLPSLDRGTGS